ncbi:unnamed protein product [Didymodactylos carnosus]|uniref:t-SNARE coiled-coil homology domain-containing protein n=1 Tax=Didymodactylos carnosus TaxID=1234261 RepID=A0A813R591_9BILA|nr:unnamed protein product [Didymodactylos carnosus]CAF0955283.1 unnamed protein product [Didymodactylos carnosus]CAF3559425.1 unnamed protein product [Didymodactylos carnosus]CAF3728656.1 unnamed protein product [Didymodactylos carnosus]
MFGSVLNHLFASNRDVFDAETAATNDQQHTKIQMEVQNFLPQVYDTWNYLQKLNMQTMKFRDVYYAYKHERNNGQRRKYFEQLKQLDEYIYKLSVITYENILTLEKIAKPALNEFNMFENIKNKQQRQSWYTPAHVRIIQNQLTSLKLSFRRIIMEQNEISQEYQDLLKRSIPASLTRLTVTTSTVEKIKKLLITKSESTNLGDSVDVQMSYRKSNQHVQIQQQQQPLTEEDIQINDLETRLEHVRQLKVRVRRMNEMTMAMYFAVQEQNNLTDNIWMNISAGSDYISQSVNELKLVKELQQNKIGRWIKLLCLAFCLFVILIIILVIVYVVVRNADK